VTIYDVADHAGVAISTVSRVLNESPDVSEPTRKRVEQAIAELKYHPNRTARSLAQQEYRSFAVALPSFTAPFQNELLKGVRSLLREIDHDLLVCDLGSTNQMESLRRFLDRGAVSGLLVCGIELTDELAEELSGARSPAVLVGHSHPGFDSWTWDEAQGAQDAVAHLIQEGHKEIMMITSSVDTPLQSERIAGYQRAMNAAGLSETDQRLVSGTIDYHSGYSEEDGYDAMIQILDNHSACTAVFCCSDVHAVGALKALRERNVSVPDGMALVGYDDVKTSRFIGLSSVDQSAQKIGYAAAKRLHERIKGPLDMAVEHHVIAPSLQVRSSSKSS